MISRGFGKLYLCCVHRRRHAPLIPSQPEGPYQVHWEEAERSRDFSWVTGAGFSWEIGLRGLGSDSERYIRTSAALEQLW